MWPSPWCVTLTLFATYSQIQRINDFKWPTNVWSKLWPWSLNWSKGKTWMNYSVYCHKTFQQIHIMKRYFISWSKNISYSQGNNSSLQNVQEVRNLISISTNLKIKEYYHGLDFCCSIEMIQRDILVRSEKNIWNITTAFHCTCNSHTLHGRMKLHGKDRHKKRMRKY